MCIDWNWFMAKIISISQNDVLRLFKMVANQTKCSRLEQRFVIKFLLAEKCKPCEIYGRKCDVYGEAYFSRKNVYKWDKLFKEGQNSIQDEGMPTIASTSEMVDSVNALILVDRRVATQDISEHQGISVGTAHKIVPDDPAFIFTRTMQGLILQQELWKPSVTRHIFHTVQIWLPLISTSLVPTKDFC